MSLEFSKEFHKKLIELNASGLCDKHIKNVLILFHQICQKNNEIAEPSIEFEIESNKLNSFVKFTWSNQFKNLRLWIYPTNYIEWSFNDNKKDEAYGVMSDYRSFLDEFMRYLNFFS